jgi:hypothetical protein
LGLLKKAIHIFYSHRGKSQTASKNFYASLSRVCLVLSPKWHYWKKGFYEGNICEYSICMCQVLIDYLSLNKL